MNFRTSYITTMVLCFVGAMVCYLDRVGFPLAYTKMAQEAGINKSTQGMIHSAFYNGYTFTQLLLTDTRACSMPLADTRSVVQNISTYLNRLALGSACARWMGVSSLWRQTRAYAVLLTLEYIFGYDDF
eukprot:1195678-Prorocentrum_minimum.AAC.7